MSSARGENSHNRSGLSDHVFQFVGITSVLLIILLTALYAIDGQVVSGLLGAGAAVLLGLTLLRSTHQNYAFVNPAILLTLIAAGNCFFVFRYGVPGIYWAFPLVFGFHIVLKHRPASILNIVFVLALGLIMVNRISWYPSSPILGSLVLSSVFAGLLARLIDRQWKGLEELVITDSLTGAYNRRYFTTRAGKLAEQLNRYDHPTSMIMFDIDHFKSINDSFGHQVGDRVLRILVDTIKARIRVVDEIFRMGGEEFVILLPDTRLDQAGGLAQVITDMVADVRVIEGGKISISCGVAELGKEEEIRNWLRRCDTALYQAKSSGRGRVCIAEPYDPDREPTLIRERSTPMFSSAG